MSTGDTYPQGFLVNNIHQEFYQHQAGLCESLAELQLLFLQTLKRKLIGCPSYTIQILDGRAFEIGSCQQRS